MPRRRHGTVTRKSAFSSRDPASAQRHFAPRRVRDDTRHWPPSPALFRPRRCLRHSARASAFAARRALNGADKRDDPRHYGSHPFRFHL